jgi:hypothetical protein
MRHAALMAVPEVVVDCDAATTPFSGEAWHHASLPSTEQHSRRLPVNPAHGTHTGA